MIRTNNNVLGIDIGTGLIKMAQVALGKNLELVKLGHIYNPVPEFSVKQSKETDRELAKAIRSCYRENGFSIKQTSLCLSDQSVIFRDIKLPEMKSDEILENIKYEITEYFSIDADQYAITYRILEKEENEGRTILRVLGVAVPSALISRYIRIIRKAGLRPAYIDVDINAYLKMIKRMKKDLVHDRTVCILDYGYTTLKISVFDNGVPFVTREVERNSKLHNFDMIVAALSQVMDYYYSRNYTSHIERVWVVGGYGHINGFCQYVSEQTGVNVEILRPEIFHIKNNTAHDVRMDVYFKSIGAAIREDFKE